MNHVGLALIAMVSYGATAVLLRLSMRTMPPEVALVITNGVLMVAAVGWMVVRAVNIPANLSLNVSTTAMFVAGGNSECQRHRLLHGSGQGTCFGGRTYIRTWHGGGGGPGHSGVR